MLLQQLIARNDCKLHSSSSGQMVAEATKDLKRSRACNVNVKEQRE